MIVVDTNTLGYLYFPTEYTEDVLKLLQRDSHWVAPLLWRSEFRSILAKYERSGLIDLRTALAMQAQAERQLAGFEYSVNSAPVLTLAIQSGCSTYDCEFLSLAISLNVPLITADKKLIKAFPEVSVTARNYLRDLS